MFTLSRYAVTSPCSELKMEKRYMNVSLTGPQAKKAKPHVIPSRKVRLMALRRFRRTWITAGENFKVLNVPSFPCLLSLLPFPEAHEKLH